MSLTFIDYDAQKTNYQQGLFIIFINPKNKPKHIEYKVIDLLLYFIATGYIMTCVVRHTEHTFYYQPALRDLSSFKYLYDNMCLCLILTHHTEFM